MSRPTGSRSSLHGAASGSAPYAKRLLGNLASLDNLKGDAWGHNDVFSKRSNNYSPQLNQLHANAPTPSTNSAASSHTGRQSNGSQQSQSQTSANQRSAGVGIRGARAVHEETVAAATRRKNEMESARLAEEQKKRERQAVDAERAEMDRQMQAMRAERDKAQLEARQVLFTIESSGTVVEVAGLVEGTSAEDVKTAFATYGSIVHCTVKDPVNHSLTARVVFTNRLDAQDACEKLNGAIADGQALSVTIVAPITLSLPITSNSQPAPVVAAPVTNFSYNTKTVPTPPTVPTGPRFASRAPRTAPPPMQVNNGGLLGRLGGPPSGPRSQQRSAPRQAPPPAALPVPLRAAAPTGPRTMYADEVEPYDPKTFSAKIPRDNNGDYSMEMDDDVQIIEQPTNRNFVNPKMSLLDRFAGNGGRGGPQNGRGGGAVRGRGGRGGGGGGGGQPPKALTLAERMGGPKAGKGSLLDRLK